MDRTYRFVLQVVFWMVIWIVLWITGGSDPIFLVTNIPAFLFQVVLLTGLLFYAIPKVLLRNRTLWFVTGVLMGVVVLSWVSSQFGLVPPPMDHGPGPGNIGPPNRSPSRFFIHLLMMVISCTMAIVIETFVYARQKEEESIMANSENLETQLKLLKSQINPHFLFNALNNIYALSVTNSDKTQQSIGTLSNMLRYVLYDCDRQWVPLVKEVDYIKDYLELFTLKSSKELPITLNLEIADEAIMIAPMLLVPFVENALKHGNISSGSDAFLNISLIATEETIHFKVKNTFSAKPEQKDHIGGIGIANVEKRLSIIYPHNHTLLISKESNIFNVDLKIDLYAGS